MIPAVVVCVVLILAYLGLYAVLTRRSAGRHVRPAEGGRVFADPADTADPDGEAYVAQLRTAGRFPYLVTDEADEASEADEAHVPDWWDEKPPAPPAVEILTGPDRRIEQTGQLTVSVLERVREGLLSVEPDGTSATFTPAPGVPMTVSNDPDTTGFQPVALRTWGKDAAELADELAARYLT